MDQENKKAGQDKVTNSSIKNILNFLEEQELTAIKAIRENKPQILCLIYFKEVSKTIVIGGSADSSIKMWDIIKDSCVRSLIGHKMQVNCLLHLKDIDDYKIVSGSSDTTIKLWDLKNNSNTAEKTFNFHSKSVNSITYFPEYDKNIIASGSSDGTIKIINFKTGENIKTFAEHTGEIHRLLNNKNISPNCFFSTGEDKSLRIWNIETSTHLKKKIGHSGVVLDLISVDSETLATCSVDSTIVLWRLSPFEIKKTLTGHHGPVRCLLSLHEAYPGIMLSASDDLFVKTWNIGSNNGECISSLKFEDFTVNCFAFLKDYGNHDIATGNTNGTIQLMKFKNN